MSDLPRIEKRIQSLRAELADLQKAAEVIRRLDLLEEDSAAEGPSRGGQDTRALPTPANDIQGDSTLAGKSAREVAEYVLRQFDPTNAGMHFRQIFDCATRLGWQRHNKDTIRRTVGSLRGRFDALGKGRYRLGSANQ